MVLTDESGTTTTEHSLISAGVALADIVAALPPSMTSARQTAALVLLLAWGAAELWLGASCVDAHGVRPTSRDTLGPPSNNCSLGAPCQDFGRRGTIVESASLFHN